MINENSSGKGRILIVDDEIAIVTLLKDILTAFEYSPIGILDPLQALELFKKEHSSIDIVLTDLSMPNLSGKKLAKLFHQIDESVPSVILTGDSEKLAEELAGEEYIFGVLNKPMMAADLISIIERAIKKKELVYA